MSKLKTIALCVSLSLLASSFVLAEEASAPSESTEAGGVIERVNLNTASLKTLETVPGLGKVHASAIINFRDMHGDFESVQDLLKVNGIGKSILGKVATYLMVE